ncbi:MAG: DUF3147 family protein [Pseudomonadota bacterium]|nr:DUF3147 family protein [Pseudomonadota bacterium]
MYLVTKILITAIIVVAVSEIAKRSTLFAGVLASIPLTSVLAITWFYYETKDLKSILDLSNSILLMIPPSLTFFIVLAFCLRYKLDFIYSLLISILSTGGVYWVYILILYRIGIRL